VKRAPLAILLLLATVAVWYFSRGPKTPEIGTREPFERIPAALAGQFSGEKALAHVAAIVEIGPRPPGSEGYAKVLDYLETEFAALGWVTRRESFPAGTPKGPVTFTNLIARHAAGVRDQSRSTPVVIGGHLDSKAIDTFRFVGANDGGSSTGVILELARVLATDPASAAKVELVLFDGEEAFLPNITPTDGLYGSKYYAHAMSKRATWPSLGIVLDLVGDSSRDFFHNPETPAGFAAAVGKAASLHGLKLRPSPGPIVDDHVPLQNTGLPCLHIIGDFMNMPYWHQPGDTMEVVDADALEKTGRTTLGFLAEVAP
jgi:Zn-dependent M28 family amino/carboxypeptidase